MWDVGNLMLGIKAGSSAKATSVLDHRANSPVHDLSLRDFLLKIPLNKYILKTRTQEIQKGFLS